MIEIIQDAGSTPATSTNFKKTKIVILYIMNEIEYRFLQKKINKLQAKLNSAERESALLKKELKQHKIQKSRAKNTKAHFSRSS